jgi:hypothetical protein
MVSQRRRQIFSHHYENLSLSERKRLGDLSWREDNIKMDIKEIIYESMRFNLIDNKSQQWATVDTVMNLQVK